MKKTLVQEYKDYAFESLIGKNQATMKMAKRFSIEQEPGKLLQVLSVKGSCNIDDVEVKEQGLQVEGVQGKCGSCRSFPVHIHNTPALYAAGSPILHTGPEAVHPLRDIR